MLKERLTKVLSGKDSKKGFTLVELIIVLVILAVLAAILVPALLGFVDKAKNKQSALDAKVIYEATQVYVDEKYAAGVLVKKTDGSDIEDKTATTAKSLQGNELNSLKDCGDAYTEITNTSGLTVKYIKVTTLDSSLSINEIEIGYMKDGEKFAMVLDDGEWSASETLKAAITWT